ncbi:MAG: hypothetical protein JST87_04905 [Bacteroidetes bacterium]|nr:hypothetical protein [Bacteroidota bacterium]
MKNTALCLCAAFLFLFSACKKNDSPSSNITSNNVTTTASSGTWRVTYYFDSGSEKTINFSGYTFTFGNSNVITATKTGPDITGTWISGNDDSKVKLILSFANPDLFAAISEDWHVIELTSLKIRLQHVSGGNTETDYLTFEKN